MRPEPAVPSRWTLRVSGPTAALPTRGARDRAGGRRVRPSVGPYAGEMGKARHGRDPLPPARAHVPRVDPVPGDDVVVPMEWPADAVTTVEDSWDRDGQPPGIWDPLGAPLDDTVGHPDWV